MFTKLILAGAAALATLATALPAHAIERIGWSKTRETMYIHGKFETGDADLIFAAIKANRRTMRGLILNSPGGKVGEGARLTDLVRGMNFDTGVTRGGVCASACFMVWAAGQNRYAYADSLIAIHSASGPNALTGQSEESLLSFAVTLKMARAYLDLKVPYYLIGVMVTTPGGDAPPYVLTDADKQEMGVQLMQ